MMGLANLIRSSLRRGAIAAAAALSPIAGCIADPLPPPPEPVTIELVNATLDDVRPNLYVSDSAGTIFDLVVAANLSTAWTDRDFPELRPLETRTITIECIDIVSAGVSQPTRFEAASLTVTPSEDQIFVGRFADPRFDCGDTIRFIFFNDGDNFRARVEFP